MYQAAISIRYTRLVLDMAILGLLQGQELHGYEIRRQLRDRLGIWANVSFGSLYPALARLERTGAVEAITTPNAATTTSPPPPPTGSLSGEWAVLRARRRDHTHRRRSRKVYRITEEGGRLFAALLEEDPGPEDARGFALRWAFARHLTPRARRSLLVRRHDQLVTRMSEVRGALADPQLDPYARSAVEHAADTLEHDVGWTQRLLEAEDASRPIHEDLEVQSKEPR